MRFFVQRRLERGRAQPTVFADPGRRLARAEPAERVARLGGGPCRLGVRREERIALPLRDAVDVPVVFRRALHAGMVPVAVATLLPPDRWCTIPADRHRVDAEGRYHHAGRAEDMFEASGIRVSPCEGGSVLVAHETVPEAAVIGRPDADGPIEPEAFAVPRERGAPSRTRVRALQAPVKAVAGPWECPRWIESVDRLPETATGEIQRFRLGERERTDGEVRS